MRLALQSDYALRTLMYLATRGQRAKISEVSRFFSISPAHVAKVVNQLARAGYIRSIRGIGGGIELARDPQAMTVGEVITTFEGRMNLLDCVTSEGVCVIESFCKLKKVMSEAERVQMEYLNSVTLRELLPTVKQLHGVAASPTES